MNQNRKIISKDKIEILQHIEEITKRFKKNTIAKNIFYITIEISCYLLCVCFLVAAFYLPNFLEMKLDVVEDEIGFYILDPDERNVWRPLVRTILVVLGLLPLLVAILLSALRKRNKVLQQVFFNTISCKE